MSDTTASIRPIQPVSPTLGTYQVQHTWVLDSTTLLPTSMRQEITFPAPTPTPAYVLYADSTGRAEI